MATAVATSKFVELGGLKFHYLDWGGEGRPLLMLHGFSGHAHTWDHTAAGLRDTHHPLALDQRGHGDSTSPRIPAPRSPSLPTAVTASRSTGPTDSSRCSSPGFETRPGHGADVGIRPGSFGPCVAPRGTPVSGP
jgi:hypothetical protein